MQTELRGGIFEGRILWYFAVFSMTHPLRFIPSIPIPFGSLVLMSCVVCIIQIFGICTLRSGNPYLLYNTHGGFLISSGAGCKAIALLYFIVRICKTFFCTFQKMMVKKLAALLLSKSTNQRQKDKLWHFLGTGGLQERTHYQGFTRYLFPIRSSSGPKRSTSRLFRTSQKCSPKRRLWI